MGADAVRAAIGGNLPVPAVILHVCRWVHHSALGGHVGRRYVVDSAST